MITLTNQTQEESQLIIYKLFKDMKLLSTTIIVFGLIQLTCATGNNTLHHDEGNVVVNNNFNVGEISRNKGIQINTDTGNIVHM